MSNLPFDNEKPQLEAAVGTGAPNHVRDVALMQYLMMHTAPPSSKGSTVGHYWHHSEQTGRINGKAESTFKEWVANLAWDMSANLSPETPEPEIQADKTRTISSTDTFLHRVPLLARNVAVMVDKGKDDIQLINRAGAGEGINLFNRALDAAPLPAAEKATLKDMLIRIAGELGVMLHIKDVNTDITVTPTGRFAVKLTLIPYANVDLRTGEAGKSTELTPLLRAAINSIVQDTAGFLPATSGAPNGSDLVIETERVVDALKGVPSSSADQMQLLGLSKTPENKVAEACCAVLASVKSEQEYEKLKSELDSAGMAPITSPIFSSVSFIDMALVTAETSGGTTSAAKRLLKEFRTGTGPDVYEFGPESVETQELLSHQYFQGLTEHMITELSNSELSYSSEEQRYTEERGDEFKKFPVSELGKVIKNIFLNTGQITVADIIGSFTMPVEIWKENGFYILRGENRMSVESFFGENVLQHGLATNPESGKYALKVHVFTWKVSIE